MSRLLTLLAPITTILFTVPQVRAANDGQWIAQPSMNLARQETGAARIDDHVYVVGGLLTGFIATPTVEAFDLTQETWTFVASLPAPRDHMGTAAAGGKLYAMGGYPGNFQARAETWAYDPGADSWSALASLPEARGACWAVEHGGKIYVFGGEDASGSVRSTTYVYDPQVDQWTQGADMLTAREHLTAVTVGDYIYVIGGRNGPSTAVNERYDPVADSWTAMTPMPTARSATAAAAFGERIFVAGGETPMLFDVHEAYDIATDSWSCAAAMPVPRHGLAAVTLDDRILVPAGGIIQGLGATEHVDAFIPPPACAATSFCTPTANSTGLPAIMSTSGSFSVAADDLVLEAAPLPAFSSGLFISSPDAANTPLGNGVLCLGTQTLGFVLRLPSEMASAGGFIDHALDISSPSVPQGQITAGSTWHFSCWFRDPPAGGALFDFADGLSVTFCP